MEAAAKECPRCRAEVFQGACFCMHCGVRLEGRAALPSSARLKPTAQPPAKRRPVTDTGYSVSTKRIKVV